MSNHIHNSIAFFCDDNRLTEVLEAIQCDNDGIGTIDFNKIIPVKNSDDRDDAWNTRCNAFHCSYSGNRVIYFDTANTPPYPIVEKLYE